MREVQATLLLLLLLLVLLGARAAEAEIHRWVDAEGRTHYTDDLRKVPAAQRPANTTSPQPGRDLAAIVAGWRDAPPLPEPRVMHGAAEGPNGMVAVAGGYAYPKGIGRKYGVKEYGIRVYEPLIGQWKQGAVPMVHVWSKTGDEPWAWSNGEIESNFKESSSWGLWYESPHVTSDGIGRLLWFTGVHVARYSFATDVWDSPRGPHLLQYGKRGYEGPLPSMIRKYGSVTRSLDGRIYLTGGKGNRIGEGRYDQIYIPTKSVDAYIPAEDRWEYLAPMSIERSNHASAVGLDGKLYVFGGCHCTQMDGKGSYTLNTTEAYDPKTNTWSERAPMPEGRQLLKASRAPDGRIFVTGGVEDPRRSASSDRVDVYDPATDSWSAGPPLRLGRHNHAQVTSSDGLIYVLGGHRASERGVRALLGSKEDYGALDSVEVLDPSGL